MVTATAPTGTAVSAGPAAPTVACKDRPESFRFMSVECNFKIMIVSLLIIFLVVRLALVTLLGLGIPSTWRNRQSLSL